MRTYNGRKAAEGRRGAEEGALYKYPKNLGGDMEKMMTKIWAIGILAVLATGIALASAQPSLAPEPATDEEAARIREQIDKWKENP